MRFKDCLLSQAESMVLIDQVDAWCRRTSTNYNRLVIAAGVNVSTRSSVRHRGRCLTFTVAARLRVAMKNHPRGITLAEHRTRTTRAEVSAFERTMLRITAELPPPRIDRTPCGKCGVRADIGCKHTQIWSAMPTGLRMAV